MKQESPRRPRAALLMSAAALLATPALAQEVATAPAAAQADTPVTPPPVVRTAPQGAVPTGESATPVNPEAAAEAAAEDAERRSARPARSAARPAVRQRAAPRAEAPAAQPAAPAAAPAAPADPATTVTEVPAAPAADTAQPQPEAAAAPAAEQPAAENATTTETTTDQGPPMWPLALIALLIVAGGIAFFVMRRRKAAADDVWDQPIAAEPAVVQPVAAEPVPAPVVERPIARPAAAAAAAGVMADRAPASDATIVTDAAPVAAEDATVVKPDGDDVAALTAAETRGDRPWLEFAMRPVRAGTNVDEALVEIELTVGNAGNMAAEDVRISTFMLPAGNDSDMERLLVARGDEAVSPLTIPAGEGTRVDATLAMSRAELLNGQESASFRPMIVADARYRLPDGSEGRTSAAFLVGAPTADGAALEPISLDDRLMREDVEARLYREPARV